MERVKRKLNVLILLALTLSILLPVNVYAETLSSLATSTKYITTYTYSSSGKVYAYKEKELKTMTGGYIDCATDECRILSINGNSVQVSYPVSGGRKTAWFSREAFTYCDLAKFDKSKTWTADRKITTYKWKNSSKESGSVSKGDVCYVIRGNIYYGWSQVIYPTGSTYKMAWVYSEPVTSLSLSDKSISLKAGGTKTITATVKPDASVEKVSWSSSDKNVATVGSSGLKTTVTAKGAGKTTITAKTSSGKTATCTVIVKKDQSMNVSFPASQLEIGKSKNLTVSNAIGSVTYTSSNDSILQVGTNGSVKAVGLGTAKVAVTAAGNSEYNTCTKTVTITTIPAGGYSVMQEDTYLFRTSLASDQYMCVGSSKTDDGSNVGIWQYNNLPNRKFRLKAEGDGYYSIWDMNSGKVLDMKTASASSVVINTYNAGKNSQKWRFYDVGSGFYCVYNKCGYYLDVANAGTVNGTDIRAWKYNGTNSQKWQMTKISADIKVTEITLSDVSITLTGIGNTKQLTAILTPSNTAETVNWTSSNTNVATIGTSGSTVLVTAKGAGTTVITAKTTSGKTATCKVNVVLLDKSISACTFTLNTTSYTYDGKEKKPSVVVMDGSKTLKKDTDYSVSYADNINAGKATVTITGKNNYKDSARKTFTINKAANTITASNIEDSTISKTGSPSKDQTLKIGAKCLGGAKLSYSSDNSNIKVDTSGNVTIKKNYAGNNNITVSAGETTNYKAVKLTIKVKITAIENKITASNFTKTKGDKAFSIGATCSDGGKLTYSSNENKVRVSSDGKVTIDPAYVGTATITIVADARGCYKKTTKKIQIEVTKQKKIVSFNQTDPRWRDVPYGYSNKAGTTKAYLGKGASGNVGSGCGVLSLTNAVYYLNGTFIEPKVIAEYSLKNGYRVNGSGTAFGLYPSFAKNRGKNYNIEYVATINSWEKLRTYLGKGYVAICSKKGHIMTIVDYNSGSNKYLLLDSCPSTSRGTKTTGYIWATYSYLKNTVELRDTFYVIKSIN